MRKLLLLAVILIATSSLYAQKRWKDDTRQDLRIGFGAYPAFVMPHDDFTNYDFHYNYYDKSIPSDTYRGARYTIGSYSLSYTYRLTRKLELGGSLSYAQTYYSTYDIITDEKINKVRLNHISILPILRLLWIQTKSFKFYSEGSLGFELTPRNSNTEQKSNVSGQITPIGLAFGKKIFGFAELGYGAQGVLRGGIGYRF